MHLPVNYTIYSVNVRGVATLTNRWLSLYGEIIQFTNAPYWSSAKLALAT